MAQFDKLCIFISIFNLTISLFLFYFLVQKMLGFDIVLKKKAKKKHSCILIQTFNNGLLNDNIFYWEGFNTENYKMIKIDTFRSNDFD